MAISADEVKRRMDHIIALANNVCLTEPSRFKAKQENIWPWDDELEIRWFPKNGVKTYSIFCGPCGQNRFYTWQNGMRCRNCLQFHSYRGFLRLQEKIHKLSRWNDGHVQKIPQPRHRDPNDKILYDPKTNKVVPLGKVNKEELRKKIREYFKQQRT